MRKTITTLSLLLGITTSTIAAEEVKSEKTFSAKPIITLFDNYHQGLGEASDESGFEHERGYLGVELKANSGVGSWRGRVVFDITSAGFNEKDQLLFEAAMKSLQLDWSRNNLTISAGVIATQNYSLQESEWGYRYVMACFEAHNKFAPSADLGISAKYKLNSKLSLDLSVINGKGYKELTFTGNYRYGIGATIKPIDNLTIRTFYDLYDDGGAGKDQHTASIYVGYKFPSWAIGAEYNHIFNYDFGAGTEIGGGSIHAKYYFNNKFNIFGRYDLRNTTNESVFESGNAFRAGVEYRPYKFLHISPNVLSEQFSDGRYSTYIYLNLLVKF